mmetsp:Transcript_15075/g.23326  ORF Transcript_15075/g.23326 Transcript_15075/m.23326 type:complete len:104 (+) Transcript_15075:2130-2441(+)
MLNGPLEPEQLTEEELMIDGDDRIEFVLSKPRKAPYGQPLEEGLIVHPLYAEYDRLLNEELKLYARIQTLAHSLIFLDEHLGIFGPNLTYRNKVKGFHLAFNI